MMRRLTTSLLLGSLILMLAACGNKGPLYLPKSEEPKPATTELDTIAPDATEGDEAENEEAGETGNTTE